MPQKQTAKEKTEGRQKQKDSIVARTKEVATMMEEAPVSIPPDMVALAQQQIQNSQIKTLRNIAKKEEMESERELEEMRSPAASGRSMFSPAQSQARSPVIDVLTQIPESDRADFIKEHSDMILGAATPGNQWMARLMHGDDGNGKSGMGDFATAMAAIASIQSQAQRDTLAMMMNMAQLNQPAPQGNGGGQNAAILQLIKSMDEKASAREEALQTRMFEMQERQLELQRQLVEERERQANEKWAAEIQSLKESLNKRGDGMSPEMIQQMIRSAKETWGVELKADQNIDNMREQHEHQLRLEELKMQKEQMAFDREMAMASANRDSQKFGALQAMVSSFGDMMMMKKQAEDGGSSAAKAMKQRVRRE